MINRRDLSAASLGLVLLGRSGAGLADDSYPNGPIRIVVPLTPGGTTDLICRVLGERVSAELGQPVVIENRAGGATVIGTQLVARSRPDGQTIMVVQAFNVIATLLQKNVPYDLSRDFAPILGVGFFPLVIAVRKDSEIRSMADLAPAARRREGGIVYASGGIGSIGHLTAASLLQELNIPGTHVPYRGNAEAMQALLGKQVQLFIPTMADALPFFRSSSLHLIGTTADQRLPGLPDVPTMGEIGYPDLNPRSWFGFLAPAGTPAATVAKLEEAFSKAVTDPAVQERLSATAFTTARLPARDLARHMESEAARWSRVIRQNNITMNN